MGSVDMIELEDESCNLIPSGHLLISPSQAAALAASRSSDWAPQRQNGPRSSLVAVSLGPSSRNEETELQVRLFCSSAGQDPSTGQQQQQQVARVYERLIRVPRFAMFALASDLGDEYHHEGRDCPEPIRMRFCLDDDSSSSSSPSGLQVSGTFVFAEPSPN